MPGKKCFSCLFFFTAVLFFPGCSQMRDAFLARYYMIKAENAYNEGYALRVKSVPYKQRQKHYRIACDYFLKGYNADLHVFTLNRITTAANACLAVKDQQAVELFTQFEAEYSAAHPKEVEYGDQGVGMSVDGG